MVGDQGLMVGQLVVWEAISHTIRRGPVVQPLCAGLLPGAALLACTGGHLSLYSMWVY